MAPIVKPEKNSTHAEPKASSAGAGDITAAEAALNARLTRKRTKTGCLTCRKRRIKCGEEKPVCKNCVKSKRQCEGYHQRVYLKVPTMDYRTAPNNAGAHITFSAIPAPAPTVQFAEPPGHVDHAHFHNLRPHFEHYAQDSGHYAVPNGPHVQPQDGHSRVLQYVPPNLPGHVSFQTVPVSSAQQLLPGAIASLPGPSQIGPVPPLANAPGHLYEQAGPFSNAASAAAFQTASLVQQQHLPPQAELRHLATTTQTPAVGLPASASGPLHHLNQGWPDGRSAHSQAHATTAAPGRHFNLPQTPVTTGQHTWAPSVYTPRPELSRPIDYQPPPTTSYYVEPTPLVSTAPPADHITPENYDQQLHIEHDTSPAHMLSAAAVETQDDDYYDVESDEEMHMDGTMTLAEQSAERQHTLNTLLAMNQITIHDLHTRRYDTFLYNGILDHYRVEHVANPLKNPATARVFAHFISATGPSLSIFQRHPRNTSVLFTEGYIPFSQQGLWTYTMPMAALRSQGLLHAMLALASLHIARLQGASETPSMQHYAWALKRVHHCVGRPEKRLRVSTIAASMLLGFYEVMTADHMKWNMHLMGSKQLIVETDFAGMARKFKQMKAERAMRLQQQQQQQQQFGQMISIQPLSQDDLLDQVHEADERVISHFVGREVRYDGLGHVGTPHSSPTPDLDLNRFEMLKDLYWWYCKQDAYQSLVSGNPLL